MQAVQLAKVKTRYAISPRPTEMAITRVLVVCRGNICRSPMAEAILRQILPADRFEIDSAAIKDWHLDKAPDPRSIAEAAQRGLDITAQRVRQVRAEDFANFDFILGMDCENLKALEALRPAGSRAQLLMLGNFQKAGSIQEIADPYDGGAEDFRACFDHILVSAQAFRRNIL